MFKAEIERVFMDYIADNNSLWDKSINELNWDIDTDDCYCYGID